MKLTSLKINALIGLTTLFIWSCNKSDLRTTEFGIDPNTQLDMLNKSIFVGGKYLDGFMPRPTSGATFGIAGYYSEITITKGAVLFLPYSITGNTSNLCGVYLSVKGSSGYWDVPLQLDTVQRQYFLKIEVPEIVNLTSFKINFSIYDCNGNISQAAEVNSTAQDVTPCPGVNSGSTGLSVLAYNMGERAGNIRITYDMYSVPDRLDVRQGNSWIATTNSVLLTPTQTPPPSTSCNSEPGYVSGSGVININYDPSRGRIVYLYMFGCLSGTAWDLTVTCPQ